MGGSTMKTAKVWKYFDQLPSEEQAAECRICSKRIKATNSSTTGMIRHLRSCHVNEYKLLQEARQSGLIAKQEEKSRAVLMKQQAELQKPKLTIHSINNIIANQCQVPLASNSQASVTASFDGPALKKVKYEDCDAIDLSTPRRPSSDFVAHASVASDKNKRVKDGFWPDDHPEAKKVTNQIGLMMLLDGEMPSIVDRAGFRGLMRLLQPKYRMPSGDTFQKTILPELIRQLKADLAVFQQELLQNRFNRAIQEAAKIQFPVVCTEPNILTTSTAPAFTGEQMNDLERVVMNSIRCAQNISQSFSHSIQLCDDDSDSSAETDTTLPARITAFLERIGKYVFPQGELIDIVTRCHKVVQRLDECQDVPESLKSLPQTMDLAACVDFVQKNLDAIHTYHYSHPIPSFAPFSAEEIQFLSALNAHLHSI